MSRDYNSLLSALEAQYPREGTLLRIPGHLRAERLRHGGARFKVPNWNVEPSAADIGISHHAVPRCLSFR